MYKFNIVNVKKSKIVLFKCPADVPGSSIGLRGFLGHEC